MDDAIIFISPPGNEVCCLCFGVRLWTLGISKSIMVWPEFLPGGKRQMISLLALFGHHEGT